MLSDAAKLFQDAWWIMVSPGIFLLATTLVFNLVGTTSATRSTPAPNASARPVEGRSYTRGH